MKYLEHALERKQTLPNTKLNVSALCLGAINFGTSLTREKSFEHLNFFTETGGNFIDTAHVYSDWIPGEKNRSEKILGEWLKDQPREKIVISTKGGHFDLKNPSVSRVTYEGIRQDIEESLAYLQTDYVDLYFLHRDNTALPAGEIIEYMNELIKEGKVKEIGCSNWTLERMAEANAYAKAHQLKCFSVNQLMWSLARINKEAIPSDFVKMDRDIYAYHKNNSMAAMCFSSQAKGYFSKRAAGKQLQKNVVDTYQNEENDRIYTELLDLQKRTGLSMTELSLQYFTRQEFPAVPIVTCNTEEQLRECIGAFSPERNDSKAFIAV